MFWRGSGDAVCACQRILENAEHGRFEREDHEQNRDKAEKTKGKTGSLANACFAVKLPRFIDIGNGRAEKKDGDVEPVGRFADRAVVGVKKNGDKEKPQKDAAPLDAPEICAL